MSRCFPYPPPHFNLAEIEAIKLQKEREKPKKEKKGKKRERKSNCTPSLYESEVGVVCKKRKLEEAFSNTKSDAKLSNELEQLEGSGLTEERGVAFSAPATQNSPESSQDSSKRRRDAIPSQESKGSVFRIKLPSAKSIDFDPSTSMPAMRSHVLEQSSHAKGVEVEVLKRQTTSTRDHINQQTNPRHRDIAKQVNLETSRLSIASEKHLPQKAAHSVFPERPVSKASPQPARGVELGSVSKNASAASNQMAQGTYPRQRVMVKPVKLEPSRLSRPEEHHLAVKPAPDAVMVQKQKEQILPEEPLHLPASMAVRSAKHVKLSIKQQSQMDQLLVPASRHLSCHNQPAEPQQPSFSGRTCEANPSGVHSSSHKISKRDKKRAKKSKKFEKVFLKWCPSELLPSSDPHNEDWLFGSAKNAVDCNRRKDDALLSSSITDSCSSLNPMAVYLPDLELYQLPYVVPY